MLHCETIFYCFLEMKNVITPICIQMLIRDKFSWNMTQYGKRQKTHKKQVLACFVNVAFNGMELDQEFIFVLNNEQEQKWGSRGSGELLLLFQYNWARSIVLHILWWKNIILSAPFLQTPRKWNLSICSLTSFDNITTTAFHCGQGVSADCVDTLNYQFVIYY